MEADVRSIDAVRDWHATLANYADSLSEALAGVEMEIRRAYEWLDEQLALWRQAIRDGEEEVVRAKAELSQRKFKTWDDREPDCTVQERALRRAKARLEHAEDQVETVRQWIGRLPKIIDETYRGAGRRLQNLLEDDLPKGQMDLARRIASLEVYAGLRPDFASGGSSGSGVIATSSSGAGASDPGPASQRPAPEALGKGPVP
jgi:hypothetical protein